MDMDTYNIPPAQSSPITRIGALIIDIAIILIALRLFRLIIGPGFSTAIITIVGVLILCLRDSIKGQSLGKLIFGVVIRNYTDPDRPDVPSIAKLFIRNLLFFKKNTNIGVYHIAERNSIVMAVVVLWSIVITLLIFFIPPLITTRTPLTPEEFVSRMEDMGFTAEDRMYFWIEEDIVDLPHGIVKASYIVESEQFVIEFVVFSTAARARSGHAETKRLAAELRGGGISTRSEVNFFGITRFTQTAGGYYIVITRINNTLVFAQTFADDRNMITDILRQLGY